MGFAKQGALRQAEAQLTRGKKVGPVLHPIGHGACAHGIGEIDGSPAGRLFAAIVRTARDELSSDLEFDEGKTVKPRKRRSLGSEIAVRSGVPRARARRRAIEHESVAKLYDHGRRCPEPGRTFPSKGFTRILASR
jgi:hypothetical protein